MEPVNATVDSAAAVWSFELFSLQGHPLTVGSVITGAVFLVLGYWLAKRASYEADRRILARMDIESGLRHNLRRGIYYFCYAIVVLATLKTLNVPLTIFTVLGGALAIGFGFGSQNIVNNFISGIIIMIERPVRPQDFIEVDGMRGTVESIGIRSTHLRTSDNRHVIVPNSVFLEKPVINWTLNDVVVRTKVVVGVAYNADPQKVRSLLLASCADVPEILANPKPYVVFADFGDNALIFEIYFWLQMGLGKLTAELESDLRFVIERQFREAGIGVPYPQRDLHLELKKPIQVELKPPRA